MDAQREPVRPQRRRGRERVAAIVAAAVELFAEREYSAVTMTEIADRSGTAIGSLYRFFPTKEHVADTILERFGDAIDEAFDICAANAPTQPVEQTASELVARIAALGPYRTAGSALADALDRAGQPATKAIERIRASMRGGIRRVLHAIAPDLPTDMVETRTLAVLVVLKATGVHMQRYPDERDRLEAELGRMLSLYLAQPATLTRPLSPEA
ncbi:TetR/AcrR family transcriptional regulator [Salinisphaera sp. Q1T1-3]|uniref:TetR/AcrR family transcriptional regulator n=1 Tax=Salinisphaera sp. Q1T1-3 TaxID=2321229 RepID=UPI000E70C5A6|nr:TetR/AcrR family transcriptional regulator [Salinisphaera sp. Q1T1-3]RJS94887.1 TetR/AcrR family transcriptional regulator [Salinisphaera sp. Q1T1-3]